MKRSLLSSFVICGIAGTLFGQATPPPAPTYNVSTVGGSINFALGDGGIAAGAALLAPVDVVVDAAGNIYISDSFSNSGRIRKIDAATGNISTLTTVTTDPTGIFLDPSGKFLYVADNGNHRIRKVDTTTGATTTYAGTGSADLTDYGCLQCTDVQTKHLATQVRMRNPRAVWVDANGNIYFTDTLNSRISRVDAASGVITQVAGRGQSNTTVAVPTGSTNGQSNALTTLNVAGDGGLANQATLANPEGIVGDNNGNIYIADTNFNRIRKVNLSSGIITTVAGLGTAGFNDIGDPSQAQLSAPKGLAIDAAGANLYIADSGNNRIRKLNLASCATTVNGQLVTAPVGCGVLTTVVGGGAGLGDGGPGLAATLNNPTGISFDAAGSLYIADQGNSRIRVLDAGNGLMRTIVGGNQGRGDGSLSTFATFNNPRGVAADTAGNLYVADTNNQKIRKIATSGIVTTVVGTGTAGNANLPPAPIFNLTTTVPPTASTNAALNFPGCVAVDQAGDIFIADRVNSKIRRVDPSGNITDLVRSNSLTVSRTGVVSGNTLATGYNGDGGPAVLDRVGVPTNAGLLSSGSSTNTNGPNCVTVDNNGNVYIADTGNNVVRKVDASGTITTVVGYATILCADRDTASGTSVNLPCSSPLAAGSPVATGVAGSEGDGGLAVNAQLNSPRGVGVDPSGRYLCIADTGNHAVRQVNLQTGIIITLAGIIPDGGSDTLPANGWQSRLNGPQGCAMDAALNTYIADTANNRITFVTPAGVESVIAGGGSTLGGDGRAATAAILNAPVGITVDSQGNVYFTDRLGLIRKLTVVK